MKFGLVLMLVSCLFWQNTAGYVLTCQDQVTIVLEPADTTNMNFDPPAVLRFSIGATPLTTFVAGTCAIESATMATFDVTDCGGVMSRNVGTDFTYTYTLWKIVQVADFSDGIARFRASCLTFSCTYPEAASVSVAVMPTIAKDGFTTDSTGTFAVTINTFTDATFATATSAAVVVPGEFFVQVELSLTGAATLRLDVVTCVVTSDTTSTSSPSYNVITNYCPDRATGVTADRTLVNNQDSLTAGFSFKSFVFTDDLTAAGALTYYVHCTAEVCETGSDCPAAEMCTSKRKKRSALESAFEPQSQRKQHHVTGTLNVMIPESCEKDNGGCDRECLMVGGTAKCSCLEGEILAANGKHCVELIEDEMIVLHTSDTSSYYYMAGMVALCVAVLVMAGVLFFKSNARSSEKKGSARFEAA